MPGKSVRKGQHRIAEQRVRMLEDMGDAEVFALYADLGTVRALCEHVWEPRNPGEQVGTGCFYEWLDADETGGRRKAWQLRKEWRSHDRIEQAERIAQLVTPETASADRVKIDGLLRVAGSLNRKDYGKQDINVSVEHNVGESLAAALVTLEAQRAEDPKLPTRERTPVERGTVVEGEYELVE